MGTVGPTSPIPSHEDEPGSAARQSAHEGAAGPSSAPLGPHSEVALSGGEGQRTLREAAFEALLPRAGRVVAGKYRVDELMARGGMGAVYAATHVVTGKRVAIKWMLPSLDAVPAATERFVREAQATARINHPNVVDIYDVGQEGSSFYLVMELLQGETLRARMRHGAMTPEECIGLLMPAMRGVGAAHAQHVVHRDLKPDNIFLCVTSDGEPREAKVLDFGISKFASDARDVALTQSGTVLGTPYYMAPEQVRGLRDVDTRADVYAFGVILYELLSGRRPFEADSYNGLILQIATERPVPLHLVHGDVPTALSEVVHKALARAPADRFQSVAELAAALEPFARGALFRLSQSTPSAPRGFATPVSAPTGPSSYPVSAGALGAASGSAHVPARETPAIGSPRFRIGRGGWLFGLATALVIAAALAAWLARPHDYRHAAPQPPAGPGVSEVSASAPANAPRRAGEPSTPAAVQAAPTAGQAVPAAGEGPGPAALPITNDSSALSVPGTTRPRGRRSAVRPGSRASTEPGTGTIADPAAASPSAPPNDALPEDWDMRLLRNVREPVAPRKPAGSLGENDFK